MARTPKVQPPTLNCRIRIELPQEANDAVVKALHVVGEALDVEAGDLSESITAPPNSYSVTVHVFPDKGKE